MKVLYLVIYIIAINIFGFLCMLLDKAKAKKGDFRISERFLLTIALLLGAPGIYVGIYVARHKTKRNNFTVGVPVLFILNCLCIYYIVTKYF